MTPHPIQGPMLKDSQEETEDTSDGTDGEMSSDDASESVSGSNEHWIANSE